MMSSLAIAAMPCRTCRTPTVASRMPAAIDVPAAKPCFRPDPVAGPLSWRTAAGPPASWAPPPWRADAPAAAVEPAPAVAPAPAFEPVPAVEPAPAVAPAPVGEPGVTLEPSDTTAHLSRFRSDPSQCAPPDESVEQVPRVKNVGIARRRGPPRWEKDPESAGGSGAKGTRTPDPHTASVVRYQLRHSPVQNNRATRGGLSRREARAFTLASRGDGGAKGTRTPDPHTASVVRYQLRHSPVLGSSPGIHSPVREENYTIAVDDNKSPGQWRRCGRR